VSGRNPQGSTQLLALEEPVDLQALHGALPDRYPFLLQSTATRLPLGRYDILFAYPGDALVLCSDGALSGPHAGADGRFLGALDRWWRSAGGTRGGSALPYSGGWFLYLGYELAAEIEPILDLPGDELLPTAFAVRCPAAVIHDRTANRSYLVSEADAGAAAAQVVADIAAAHSKRRATACPAAPVLGEDDPQRFLDAVDLAKAHIAAGDVYQANLSRGWCARFEQAPDPLRLYSALSRTNPAPFAGLVRWGSTSIVSSSPERLLRIQDGIASTRPIAGTRPRARGSDADSRLSAELFAHPKERAEHVMLIDLERNDLGRVCEAGSVEVDEMMVLESYAHVHHIVSNVRGRLRAGVSPGEAIAAVFPGGTITGCPKVRCMQIIRELEDVARGAYTGSFGYLNLDGSLDLNILIRTMVVCDRSLWLRAGAGIVADSVAAAELAETRAKAEGVLRALAA